LEILTKRNHKVNKVTENIKSMTWTCPKCKSKEMCAYILYLKAAPG